MSNPYGPTPSPSAPAGNTLDAQQKTIAGCGGMVVIAFVLLLIAAACAPAAEVRTKPVPGPTVTVTATRAVTASPSASASEEVPMPKVVGGTFAAAETRIEELIDGDLTAYSAYSDVDLPSGHGNWIVCFQGPDSGTELVVKYADPNVHLVAPGTKCPKQKNTNLHSPEPKPTPETDDGSGDSSVSGGSTGDSTSSGGGGGSVYYSNCAAVRAAGADPIRRGDPGFGGHLDRDGDGVACE